jgi:hypothetical protein
MFRLLGMFGLGILFLLISPGLRGNVLDAFAACGIFLDHYSPFSYVGVAVVVLAGMMFGVYRAAQPR